MQNVQSEKVKIIDSFWTFFVALVFVGPFALPLLWRNPRLNGRNKIILSALIVLMTLGLLWFSKVFLGDLLDRYQELKSLQESRP